LANNPDLSTDAGQFAMIESIKPTDKRIQFEFIAAVPREMVSFGIVANHSKFFSCMIIVHCTGPMDFLLTIVDFLLVCVALTEYGWI
jgi:hypothetical protein